MMTTKMMLKFPLKLNLILMMVMMKLNLILMMMMMKLKLLFFLIPLTLLVPQRILSYRPLQEIFPTGMRC